MGIFKQRIESPSPVEYCIEMEDGRWLNMIDNVKMKEAWREWVPKEKSEQTLLEEFDEYFVYLGDEEKTAEETILEELGEYFVDLGDEGEDKSESEDSISEHTKLNLQVPHGEHYTDLFVTQKEYEAYYHDITHLLLDKDKVNYECLFDTECSLDDDFAPVDLDEKHLRDDRNKSIQAGEFEHMVDKTMFELKCTATNLRKRVPSQHLTRKQRNAIINGTQAELGETSPTESDGFDETSLH